MDRWPARPGRSQHDWEPPRVVAKPNRAEKLRRKNRLCALGNAVVPAQAEAIGVVLRELDARLCEAP